MNFFKLFGSTKQEECRAAAANAAISVEQVNVGRHKDRVHEQLSTAGKTTTERNLDDAEKQFAAAIWARRQCESTERGHESGLW
jgi:hypothetical protein